MFKEVSNGDLLLLVSGCKFSIQQQFCMHDTILWWEKLEERQSDFAWVKSFIAELEACRAVTLPSCSNEPPNQALGVSQTLPFQ